MNAGSSTYRDSSITYAKDEEEDNLEGFGAEAARGSNGEFRYGIADVSGAQGSGSSGAHGYSTGEAGSQSNAYGARSGGGHSYSTSSSSSSGK